MRASAAAVVVLAVMIAVQPARLSAALKILGFKPWKDPYPNRLASITEAESDIDNVAPYSGGEDDWALTGRHAGLHIMNGARVRHFLGAAETRLRELRGPDMPEPRVRILDAGCGGGLVSEALVHGSESRGFVVEVTGVDVSKSSIEYARKRAEAGFETSRITFLEGDLYNLRTASIPEGSFDLVIASDVMEHLHRLRDAVREFKRVLVPGGMLCFDTIQRTKLTWVVAANLFEVLGIVPKGTHDWRLFIQPGELAALLLEEGFEPVNEPVAHADEWMVGIAPTFSGVLNLAGLRSGLTRKLWNDRGFTTTRLSWSSISYMGCARLVPDAAGPAMAADAAD